MSTTDRAAFEQYAESQGCRDFEYDQDDSQRYRNPFTQREYKYWRAALDWQAATEAAKATGTALQPMTMSYVQNVPDQCDRITWRGAYYRLKEGAEAARHDKDGNHADDLRGMLDELQTEFDKQQSAFWACSEKLAQFQRDQETELSDIRILELAEEDFGEQDDRNVKNEALLSFARRVQAARQPAPALQGEPDAFMVIQGGDEPVSVHFQRVNAKISANKFSASEIVPLYRAALAATAAPVLGLKMVCDPNMPSDQVEFRVNGETVGRIVNIATRSEP